MSYDLVVFAPTAMAADDLVRFVTTQAGLSVKRSASGDHLSVARGRRGRGSFTIDGPLAVEADDVPHEVTAAVLGAAWQYEVLVEGSSASEITHARRFARRLATELRGAVFDPQLDEVWSRSGLRHVARPTRERRIDLLELSWYAATARQERDFAEVLLDAATRHLPEARPRRWGEFEPLQERWDVSGRERFLADRKSATMIFFFRSTSPVIGGHMTADEAGPPSRRVRSASLSLQLDGLNESWLDGVRAFFTSVADDMSAFVATAEVVRRYLWSGRDAFSDAQTESLISPARMKPAWSGLPPYRTWLTYLGEPYLAEVLRGQPKVDLTPTAHGALLTESEVPLPRDALDRLGADPLASFRARIASSATDIRPVPLKRAEIVPAGLLEAPGSAASRDDG